MPLKSQGIVTFNNWYSAISHNVIDGKMYLLLITLNTYCATTSITYFGYGSR